MSQILGGCCKALDEKMSAEGEAWTKSSLAQKSRRRTFPSRSETLTNIHVRDCSGSAFTIFTGRLWREKNFEKSNIAFSGWLWRCWKRVLHRRATLTQNAGKCYFKVYLRTKISDRRPCSEICFGHYGIKRCYLPRSAFSLLHQILGT